MTAADETRVMPPNERALIEIFSNAPGALGLLIGGDGEPSGAWHLAHRDSEGGYAFTTTGGGTCPWIRGEETNPLAWVYTDPPAWEGHEVPIYEITRGGLVDVARDPDSGVVRSGKEIAEALQGAGRGRFFAIGERGYQFPCLFTRDSEGNWVGSGCGGDLRFDGAYPHTGDALDEFVEEAGYDTPFFGGIPASSEADQRSEAAQIIGSVARVVVVGTSPISGDDSQ